MAGGRKAKDERRRNVASEHGTAIQNPKSKIQNPEDDRPKYVISVAAEILHLHPQTLRLYEREGLVEPKRTGGKIRLYSERDIERVRSVTRLTNQLGVNLAGAEAILNMRERMIEMQREMDEMRRLMEAEMRELRRLLDI